MEWTKKKETLKKWAESDSEVIEYIEKEIKEIKESIGGLKGKPEFAGETKVLETEVKSLEAALSEMKAPEIPKIELEELDKISAQSIDIMKAIDAERSALQQIRGKGITIPSNIKRKLITYGNWLLSLQRWLLWLANRWWLPGSVKRTLRNIARVATEIGNLLIWIARNFC